MSDEGHQWWEVRTPTLSSYWLSLDSFSFLQINPYFTTFQPIHGCLGPGNPVAHRKQKQSCVEKRHIQEVPIQEEEGVEKYLSTSCRVQSD